LEVPVENEQPWYQTLVMPALLRHARSAYGQAMRAALAAIDCEDMPRNGMWVVGGLAMGAGGVPLGDLVRDLGVSKQAAGQLVDTLVLRGYLERNVDPTDRRKLTVTLTPRGQAAAAAQKTAREKIDAELLARLGPQKLAHAREVLGALTQMALDARCHGEDRQAN
jgi:DNA-binding MarR family transcriptional regulator